MPHQPARPILVTGGGRGLGRAIAARLAQDGAAVGLVARTESELLETAREIRSNCGQAETYVADVRDPGRLVDVAKAFADHAGGIEGLVVAAGRLHAVGPLADLNLDVWRDDFDTAFLGAVHAIRAAYPYLNASRRGSIVVLVGPGHAAEFAHASAYAAAQAALVRLVETLAVEFADGPLIHALNPGVVPTKLIKHLLDSTEGRRFLPRVGDVFAEGKEVDAQPAANLAAWLFEQRPTALNGRVVSALATPDILETRLDRILSENLGVLRLR